MEYQDKESESTKKQEQKCPTYHYPVPVTADTAPGLLFVVKYCARLCVACRGRDTGWLGLDRWQHVGHDTPVPDLSSNDRSDIDV